MLNAHTETQISTLIPFPQVEEGWWRGRMANRTGVFPSNFVVMESQLPALAADRRSHQTTNAPSQSTASISNVATHQSSSQSASSSNSSTTTTTTTAIHSYATASQPNDAPPSHNASSGAAAAATTLLPDVALDAPILPPKPGEFFFVARGSVERTCMCM